MTNPDAALVVGYTCLPCKTFLSVFDYDTLRDKGCDHVWDAVVLKATMDRLNKPSPTRIAELVEEWWLTDYEDCTDNCGGPKLHLDLLVQRLCTGGRK